jgi:hypothetical protein
LAELLITFGPLVLFGVTALVATPIMRPLGPDLSGSRVPIGLLAAQVALAPLAWGLVWAAPNEQTVAGSSCPQIESGSTLEIALYVLFSASCMLGGLALAATYAADRPRLGRSFLFALIALLAAFGIAATAAYDVLCGAS